MDFYIFYYTMSQIFSLFLKNRWKAHGLLLAIIVILDSIKRAIPKFNIFNPITYLYIDEVVRGEFGPRYNLSNINTKNGVFILLVLIIFIYFIGKFYSKKEKNIL